MRLEAEYRASVSKLVRRAAWTVSGLAVLEIVFFTLTADAGHRGEMAILSLLFAAGTVILGLLVTLGLFLAVAAHYRNLHALQHEMGRDDEEADERAASP